MSFKYQNILLGVSNQSEELCIDCKITELQS
jgi:hypothetical protein